MGITFTVGSGWRKTMNDPVVNLFKDFLNSDFMDSLILYRLKDDYATVVAYIDGLSERAMSKSLSDIDLKDFDMLMDDMIGLQQVISMYEHESDLPAPVIPHTLMEIWVQWKKNNP